MGKVTKIFRKTASVMLASVMAGSACYAPVMAATGTGTTQSFSLGRVGTILDSVKDLISGDDAIEKDTHKKADTFASKCLIVKADKLKNIDKKKVIASYDGYYLLKYRTQKEAKKAYDKYSAKANGKSAIAADQPVHMATGSADAGGLTNVTKKDNPLAELKDNVSDITKAEVKKAEKKKVIALLDTGASTSSNVIESVSMLGGSGKDDNGHGEAMVKAITKENKKAQIISIKVLDKNGEGSVSSIVSGIAYAEKRGASIVNLSLSGLATQGNAVVTTAVNDAIRKGMIVVGAAGNNARDAKFYIPGSIPGAIILGACDAKGKRIASSNYGDTVDYNAVANSTSEAAAMMSGYLSANMKDDGSYEIDTSGKGPFFKPEEDDMTDASRETYEVNSLPADKTKRVMIRYLIADRDSLKNDSTVADVLLKHDEGIQSVIVNYAYPHKTSDGKYKIVANAPFFNGVKTDDGPVNAEFARANDAGQYITKGVNYNSSTGIATVSESAFKKDIYGDLQMEVLIPAKVGPKATVMARIENDKGELLDQTVSTQSPFVGSSIYLHADGENNRPLKKSDIHVFVDGDNTPIPEDEFYYDAEKNAVTTDIASGAQNSIVIRVDGAKASDKFSAQFTKKYLGLNVPGYWLSARANSNGEFLEKNMPIGWKVNCKLYADTGRHADGLDTAKHKYKQALPRQLLDAMGEGGLKVWEQGPDLGTLSIPKEIEKDGTTYDFKLYKNAGEKNYIGDNPNDKHYTAPFDAYCFHIINKAAKYGNKEVNGSIRVIDRFDDDPVNGKVYNDIIVFGVRENDDTWGGDTDVAHDPSSWMYGMHQHQGFIFMLKIHRTESKKASVTKKWAVTPHPASAHVKLVCSSDNLSDEGKKIVKKYEDKTLTKSNDWSYTTKSELPAYDKDGKSVSYHWREINLPNGWYPKYTDVKSKNKTSIVNDHHEHPNTSTTKDWEGYGDDPVHPEFTVVNGGRIEKVEVSSVAVRLSWKTWVRDAQGNKTSASTDHYKDMVLRAGSDGEWSMNKDMGEDDHSFKWEEIGWHKKGEDGNTWHTMAELPRNTISYEKDGKTTIIHNARPDDSNPVYTEAAVDKYWLLGTAYVPAAVDSVQVKLYRSIPGGAEEEAKDNNGNAVVYTLSNANSWHAETPAQSLPAYDTEFSIPPETNPEAHEYSYVWREVPNTAMYAGKNFSSLMAAVDESDSEVDNQIKYPSFHTSAVSFTTGTKAGAEKADEVVQDTVSINNLIPTHSYTLYAEVRRKSTNTVIGSGSISFTPGTELEPDREFTRTINIGVNTAGARNDDIVVFETLNDDSAAMAVAGEYDMNDIAQTVHIPEIKTHMVSDNPLNDLAHKYDGTFDTDGKHYGATAENETDRRITMTDTVSYKNLASGTYVVRGELHRKDRNSDHDFGVIANAESNTFSVNVGDGVTNGTTSVRYSFDYTDEMFGSDFVSYEKLYYVGNGHNSELTSHAELNDKSQTVRMPTRIRIIKQDQQTGKAQPHALIGLYTKDGNGDLHEYMHNGKHYVLETDDNGTALFCNLDPGEYWFKELKTSEGHNLMATPFKINAEYYKTRQMILDEQETLLLTTGGSGTTIFYIAAGIVAFASAAAYVFARRKRNHKLTN